MAMRFGILFVLPAMLVLLGLTGAGIWALARAAGRYALLVAMIPILFLLAAPAAISGFASSIALGAVAVLAIGVVTTASALGARSRRKPIVLLGALAAGLVLIAHVGLPLAIGMRIFGSDRPARYLSHTSHQEIHVHPNSPTLESPTLRVRTIDGQADIRTDSWIVRDGNGTVVTQAETKPDSATAVRRPAPSVGFGQATPKWSVNWASLLVLGGLVVGLVVLVVTRLARQGRGGQVAAIVGAVIVVVLLAVAALGLLRFRRTTVREVHQVAEQERSISGMKAEHAWSSADQFLLADVYPSLESAAEAAAAALGRDLPARVRNRPIKVVHAIGDAGQRARQAAGEAFRKALARSGIDVDTLRIAPDYDVRDGEPQDKSDWLTIEVTSANLDDPPYPKGHPEYDPARPQEAVWVKVQGEPGVNQAAFYRHVPWLADFDTFAANNPGRYLLGRSTEPASTTAEARRQAIARVAESLLPEVMQEVDAQSSPVNVPTDDLLPRVTEAVAANIHDQFSQAFHRPYGNVHRSAVLLKWDPPLARSIASRHIQAHRATRQSWVQQILSTGVLCAIIGLIYVLLNWATRGYYTWSLRAVTVILLAVGLVVLLLMA